MAPGPSECSIASGIQGDGDSDDEEGEEENPVCRLAFTYPDDPRCYCHVQPSLNCLTALVSVAGDPEMSSSGPRVAERTVTSASEQDTGKQL